MTTLIPSIKLTILLFIVFFRISAGRSFTSSKKVVDTTFTFKNDTLFSNVGFKIFVGQKLIVGKGSEDHGRYQTLIFRSPAAISLLLFRKTELANDPEYRLDPPLRDQDKVKEYLTVGKSLIVTKIKLKGNEMQLHHYLLYLSDGEASSLVNKFTCADFEYAIKLKELLIQQ